VSSLLSVSLLTTSLLSHSTSPDAPSPTEDGPSNPLAQWKVFSGNEIGVILGHYQITKYLSSSPTMDRSRGAVVSTVVSSRMLQTITEKEGLFYSDTLTGFKWIGNESLRLQQDGYHVLFSYEEALGYCVGDIICDKDGISAAITISELINTLAAQSKTLLQYYHEIQQQYGLFVSYNTYVFSHNKEVTKEIFKRLREINSLPAASTADDEGGEGNRGAGYWKQTGSVAVKRIRDITHGYDSHSEDGKSSLPVTPDSEMLMFEFENQCTLIIRTSGTEPKIKCYSEMVSKDSDLTEEMIRSQLKNFIELCIEEMIQPHVHGLTRP
jgi:phosphomannomutase